MKSSLLIRWYGSHARDPYAFARTLATNQRAPKSPDGPHEMLDAQTEAQIAICILQALEIIILFS
jgi:hypothetical protein